jgi:hypothetical protein
MTPRFHVVWDRYGFSRVVLVVGRGSGLRVVDWQPRLSAAV